MEEPPAETAAPAVTAPEPPRDRGIWVVANVIIPDELGTCVEAYEGYAKWDEKTRDWLDRRGLSIRQVFESEFRILSWMECAERARHCPETEISTNASIYHWDDEWRRAQGLAGYFVVLDLYHPLTCVHFSARTEGPFATRAEAIAALTRMILAPVPCPPKS